MHELKDSHFYSIRILTSIVWIILLSACQPETPVTSLITIEADGLTIPVNQDLYGITLEEINHGIEGGLYAELIRNRSFEEGVPPLNCPYSVSRNVLITPNGWTIPFIRGDSIPGWHRISTSNTWIALDMQEVINARNHRSLLVSIATTAEMGRGGIVAEGYQGMAIRKGDTYDLSLFAKGVNLVPRTIHVALEDSTTSTTLSDVYSIAPTLEWQRYRHTFTAKEDAHNAVLTITADSSILFRVDVVSLFPHNTWKNRPNGTRADLATLIDSLAPRFIRFPGGSFVEGYTAGTFPIWRETIGDISTRKHFWNIWAYGSTNGMGYHEYLQLCEDMGAEPVYVIHSGVTSQSRRPRYEDITMMDKWVKDALEAIAYANEPADSTFGAMRAANGHPEPFQLKYVEIGSENYGTEYTRRFRLFQKAIKETYPEVTVISSSPITKRGRSEWADTHYYAGGDFFSSNSRRFDSERYARRSSAVFIGEFGTMTHALAGTLRAAVTEACFLIGAERHPNIVRRLAYAPILGNVGYERQRYPLILFDTERAVVSPSYHLLKLFNQYQGDELLNTTVDTYEKPQANTGRAGIEMFDNSYEFKEVCIDGKPITDISVIRGGWSLSEPGHPVPVPNRWNHVLYGDSTLYAYEYTAMIRRTKGSGQIQLRLRDNGQSGEQADYLCMTIGQDISELYHQAGGVKDTLSAPVPYPFVSKRWYKIRMRCENEYIRCYVNDTLIHEAQMSPIPSLVSVASLDKEKRMIYLKVVNTTWHEEKTSLHIEGATIQNEAELIQLKGEPEMRNTFDNPTAIVPFTETIHFPISRPLIYSFPPNSISILKLQLE